MSRAEETLFEAFIKSVQYIVGLESQQDVRDHLGKLITAHLPAEWVAFAECGPEGCAVIGHSTLDPAIVQDAIDADVQQVIADVLDNGFLACELTSPGAPAMTAFLPVVEESRPRAVMLVGHKTTEPIPKELLNVYLAIAGLTGTTQERLRSEIELSRYRSRLEDLVRERTSELLTANERLTLEIVDRLAAEKALHAERERLSITLRSIGDGVIATDTEARVVLLNGVAEELTGWTLAEAEGRPIAEVFNIVKEQTREPAVIPVDEVLRTGEIAELANHTVLISRDGTEYSVADSCAPIRAQDGSITGAVLVFRDVTEQHRSEVLRDALDEINKAIGSSLDVDAIMLAVVDEAVQALGCEKATVQFTTDDGWQISHATPNIGAVIGTRFRFDEARWFDSGQDATPLFLAGARLDEVLPEGLIKTLDAQSVVFMPIVTRGEVIAALGFVDLATSSAFSAAQMDFVRKLSASLSLAVENARLYEAERNISQTLQEALICIPETLPGMELGHRYHSATKTAKVGGDFYDVFQIQPDKIGILIGDVAGHGLSAATLTLLVQNTIKAFAHQGYAPAEVMARANDIICGETENCVFVTVFFGVLERESGRLSYCSGGHPPAMMRRDAGDIELLATECPVVGGFDGMEFDERETRMVSGDTLVLYTDGVTEARDENGEFFGQDRLVSTVEDGREASELTQFIFERVLEFTGGSLNDDVAILTISPIGK